MEELSKLYENIDHDIKPLSKNYFNQRKVEVNSYSHGKTKLIMTVNELQARRNDHYQPNRSQLAHKRSSFDRQPTPIYHQIQAQVGFYGSMRPHPYARPVYPMPHYPTFSK